VRAVIVGALAVLAIAAAIVLVEHRGGSDGNDEPAAGDVWSSQGFFGVNAPLLREYTQPNRLASLDALARSMAAAGVSWARIVFDQAVEQQDPGQTDWSIPDRLVAALALHGVRTQALFVGTAVWARELPVALGCGERAFPGDVEAWSGFVGEAVARYGREGDFWREHPGIPRLPIETWEIGNEQNLGIFWCPAADPEAYAEVYSAVRLAAHSADRDAHVIVGGLAPAFGSAAPRGDVTVADFLKGMISADPELADRIPAVAVHLYARKPAEMLRELRLYRQAMRAAGLGRTPMLVDEFGWHTAGVPDARQATEAERASRIRRLTVASRRTDCGVVGLGVHSWVTAQVDPRNPEDWYGLADPITGAPNESGRAYASGIAASGRARATAGPLSRLCG
jgi:hypothetical protein